MNKETKEGKPEAEKRSSAPSISLPKGGGAIRGIGEKFSASPVMGTGSFSVPLATSPGRSGFDPELALSYDSGSGNGPFGFGWSLPLPSITRKTDKGLPKYQDGDESDTFILSGAEDLVPILKKQGKNWVLEKVPDRTIGTETFQIKRYRPRTEGLFARIERWTSIKSRETHWRSISGDNVVTVYGKTSNSRIEDPSAPESSPRVFSWLICESYDDKGNAIYYEYEPEDSAGIDLSQANERNRTEKTRSSNRYLKRIKYGNKEPVIYKSNLPREFVEDLSERDDWLFEVVFDYLTEEKNNVIYGQHYKQLEPDADKQSFIEQPSTKNLKPWGARKDPFSSFRAGFEVRTYRLCHRVLMFHHFPDELGEKDYLVRSTGFKYDESPIASFITGVTQSGYKRQDNGTFLKKSLPPLEFEYNKATIQDKVEIVEEESIENLPQGLDGTLYQWADLDGEGLSGILTEQANSWFYKRNISALPVMDKDDKPQIKARFEPIECLTTIPSLTNLSTGRQQLLDLAGDGQLDVVELDGPTPGFYERTNNEAWQTFKPFKSLPNISWQDPNLKFVDLTGDGHTDIFITENDVFSWYPSLAEAGYASCERVRQALDEEKGPKLVFADGTQSIYLSDISGDGLTDLVRIRNGEVCYWPNLGYGRFGAKVTMDNSPFFDASDLFNQRRIRLADIDGSGVTDIIYLKDDGVYIYLNESGNSWSEAEKLKLFPKIDNLSSVMAVDLLGNGTACLVWSSPLPDANGKPLRYIDLMGGHKPHLLVKTKNNLGAETHVHYAPSTKFYLADKLAGKPWITKIPFPVHVVEQVEVYDQISKNIFVTRYTYHHGYFDGFEREFRGFGMVEQWDTEEYDTLKKSQDVSPCDNIDESSHVPPVWTKTWFHTGVYIGRNHISNFFAGLIDANDRGEYYREPGLTDDQAQELLLEDTIIPDGLTVDEEREACRALKGSMLRQEVYALDGTDKETHPYTVTEQNFTIRCLQPKKDNQHSVFFTHAREAINYHYERIPEDPRVSHALTLQVDKYGNVRKSAAIGYRRRPGMSQLQGEDRKEQEQILMTYTENEITNAIDLPIDNPNYDPDNYRTPLPFKVCTYEVTGLVPDNNASRFTFDELEKKNFEKLHTLPIVPYETPVDYTKKRKRLIEAVRTLYRKNDLTALLPLGKVEFMALPGETYKLAFTPGLLTKVYERNNQPLLTNPANILGGQGPDQGGYVDLDNDGHWWIPSGKVFYSTGANDTAQKELTYARKHFFLPHRYQDPFGQTSTITYDKYDLLMLETCDALINRVKADNNFRVLQPHLVTDPNGNRSQVKFDALGLVAGTAVMGKDTEQKGDLLTNFKADLTESEIDTFFANPTLAAATALLGKATTRLVYDPDRCQRTGQPPFAATLARETHFYDPLPEHGLKIQLSFSYSDGLGREIQKKIQAEKGKVPLRDENNRIRVDTNGQPVMSQDERESRWVGSGWTVFNNKGKPVRQYEPFFTDTHAFDFDVRIGVSPVLFYDPVERVIATLHPNHTYEKVVFDPWQQETWDVNDTVLQSDPKNDPHVGDFFSRLPDAEYLPTWHDRRKKGKLGAAEQSAAQKAEEHAETQDVAYLDVLGRTFLTVADNGLDANGTPQKYKTSVMLDIEGNEKEVIDANKRIVMRYDYYMAGPEEDEDEEEEDQIPANRIYQISMEAGERWILNDVTGNPIYAWDSRVHIFKTTYDKLRRPISQIVRGTDPQHSDPRTLNKDIQFEKIEYGEDQANDKVLNLRTRVFKSYDNAGMVKNEEYDFKGNLLHTSRTLAKDYKKLHNWNVDTVKPSWEKFSSSTTYDALNRPLTSTSPDGSVYKPMFNDANLLEKVWVNLRGKKEDDQPVWTPFVTNINYDAKGQRTLIAYQNGAKTEYTYDHFTYRLTNLKTTRTAGPNGLAAQIFIDPTVVQNLYYTYDPAGNITRIKDAALKTVLHNNQQVDPVSNYTYDPIYRLIKAEGREHIGQTKFDFNPANKNYRDYSFTGLQAHSNDLQALRYYTERYNYDPVGNFKDMHHVGQWKRTYKYDEESLIQQGKKSNRLTRTTLGNGLNYIENYAHDVHGNMTSMPHLSKIEWDFEDQMQVVERCTTKAYYAYDADGERVRKVVEKNNCTTIEERIYLGGCEIFRRHQGNSLKLERETLHIMDDEQRIALVDTKTKDTSVHPEPLPDPVSLTRYQLGNHLGSASLELDPTGAVISYEEYYPYGTTSFQAGRTLKEISLKRYRYTGKERDDSTGLYYYGARYYAPWMGRWVSTDPLYIKDSLNLYEYVGGNPISFIDVNGLRREKTWVVKIADDLNKKHRTGGIRSKYIGKSFYNDVDFYKQKILNLPISDRKKRQFRNLSATGAKRFLNKHFKVWGCDALVRLTLKRWSQRPGNVEGWEKVPKRSRSETFNITMELRKLGWKVYLLDYFARSSTTRRSRLRTRQIEKVTKVTIDKVLAKKEILEGGLNVITNRDYYFGMTKGAVHNFIGTKKETLHGEWEVFPEKTGLKMVTSKPLIQYLKKKQLIIVIPPPLKKPKRQTIMIPGLLKTKSGLMVLGPFPLRAR